jgi:hypothetical protein
MLPSDNHIEQTVIPDESLVFLQEHGDIDVKKIFNTVGGDKEAMRIIKLIAQALKQNPNLDGKSATALCKELGVFTKEWLKCRVCLTGTRIKGRNECQVCKMEHKRIYRAKEVSSLKKKQKVAPTGVPIGASPFAAPIGASPFAAPTGAPTGSLTGSPTGAPTGSPTGAPTGSPTGVPTGAPTGSPTGFPTCALTGVPTGSPTGASPFAPTGASPFASIGASPFASIGASPFASIGAPTSPLFNEFSSLLEAPSIPLSASFFDALNS